jgi:flavin reductase (DIM6/NTAB) family NADH-FMN oxidoreductase RutF
MFKTIENGYTLGYVPRPLVIVVVGENPFTVGWHTPVNKNPFLYSISIDKTNYSYRLLKDNFTINFLTSEYFEQILIAGSYHGDQVNKLSLMENIHLIDSQKVASKSILESFMVYECEVYEKIEFEDHALVIGKVLAIEYKQGKVKPKNKLVFSMGKNYYCFNTKGFYKKI